MRYEGSVYRPPSEASSLILQATIGCSHNQCTFCSMYKAKQFRIRPMAELIEDLEVAKHHYGAIKRLFIADGDALIAPLPFLLELLGHIKRLFPSCERIGIYASPKSILKKSPEALEQLRLAGIGIVYLGLESGHDETLVAIQKGATSDELIEAGLKIKSSGMKLSTMLISGLGGKRRWHEHALASARVINAIEPDYIGLLTLMIEPDTPLFNDYQNGQFELLSATEVLEETKLFLEQLTVRQGTFRSNHASNYLNLAGDLPQDQPQLIAQISRLLSEGGRIKSESYRRL